MRFLTITSIAIFAIAIPASAAEYPKPTESDYAIPNFRFANGQTLPEVRMHYRTLGAPRRDASGVVLNAVLILHGTGGAGTTFIRNEFAGELFGKDQPLDAQRYFIVIPDDLGHGKSSKPSDGLRMKFPSYVYADMIEAEHRLLVDGLKVDHLRLVMGTSMGGMHTWLWGEKYPAMMDALLPLASLPEQISGRNRVWRRMIADAIRSDPQWKNGDYTTQPTGLRQAAYMLYFMSENPAQRYKEAPTGEQADKALDAYAANILKTYDANDLLYAIESSRDYDPAPALESIQAPLLAINFADDLINPPDLGILEHQIKRVPHGKALLIPESPQTRGHGTHTLAAVWKEHLVELLKETEK